jgi:hypothetical protein
MNEHRHIYLAGKVENDLSSVSTFADELENRGHTITYKWWEHDCPKPFLAPENYALSQAASLSMEAGVKKSDTFILLAHSAILGAAIEFGIAMGYNGRRDVYVVLDDERSSIFYAHPAVQMMDTIDELRKTDWY